MGDLGETKDMRPVSYTLFHFGSDRVVQPTEFEIPSAKSPKESNLYYYHLCEKFITLRPLFGSRRPTDPPKPDEYPIPDAPKAEHVAALLE